MTIQTRYSKADDWKTASTELLIHYFDTNDPKEVEKCFKYLNCKINKNWCKIILQYK